YRYSNRVGHLDNAVYWLRLSLEQTPEDSPLRIRILSNLITVVRARSSIKKDNIELPDLAELERELALAESAPVEDRLAAAASWGRTAAKEDPATGLPGLSTAVELLPRAAWWGQTRE